MTPAIYDQYTKIVLHALLTAKIKLNKCRSNFIKELLYFGTLVA
jgi:hypothetical protein